MDFQCYYGILLSLSDSCVIMEFQYGIPVSIWNSSVIMEFYCHYGIPKLLWNSIAIMEFQCYYTIVVMVVEESPKRKNQLLRLLESAPSQKRNCFFNQKIDFYPLTESRPPLILAD